MEQQPEDVQVASSTTHKEIDLSGLERLFESKSESGLTESQSGENEGSLEAEDLSKVEAKKEDKAEEKVEEKTDTKSKGAESRIRQLNAKLQEERLEKINLKKQVELMQLAMEEFKEIASQKKSKLAEYGLDSDAKEDELFQYKLKEKLSQREKELTDKFAEELHRHEVETRAEIIKQQIVSQIESAALEFEGIVSAQDIALAMQHSSYGGETPSELAKKIYSVREKMFAQKLKSVEKPAPKTVTQKKALPLQKTTSSNAEIAASLEKDLGHLFKR